MAFGFPKINTFWTNDSGKVSALSPQSYASREQHKCLENTHQILRGNAFGQTQKT